ncbi:MAG: hypothetical protein ACUVQW_07180 [Candidatus Bathycorpusculaceae bacterium]
MEETRDRVNWPEEIRKSIIKKLGELERGQTIGRWRRCWLSYRFNPRARSQALLMRIEMLIDASALAAYVLKK